MHAEAHFKPNWLAIFAILAGLITVGWLLGMMSGMPNGKTIQCPSTDLVQVVDVKGGVVVFCQE